MDHGKTQTTQDRSATQYLVVKAKEQPSAFQATRPGIARFEVLAVIK
jgi:hypothetical protein